MDGKTIQYYCINGKWNPIHASQSNEYEAFELAKSLNETAAYESISMGLPQIMGFNYLEIGYTSAKEMYNDLSLSEDNQLIAFGSFIANYRSGNLLVAFQNRDFDQISSIYNNGSAAYSSKLIEATTKYGNTL